MSDIHAERRDPAPPDGALDLLGTGDDLMREAAELAAGRAARTLTPGAHAPLKQTLVALRAGTELSEHDANGPTTIQLLRGAATLHAGDDEVALRGGQWAIIPEVRHGLTAEEDTLALITVAPRASADRTA